MSDKPTPPAYLPAVLALAPACLPGRVTEIYVLHDDGCGIWRGAGCGCDPQVTTALPEPEGET